MKRKIVFALFLLPTVVLAQSHSWDGKSISPNAQIRCLNIFVNIIYDIHPDTNVFYNNEYWPMLTDTNSEGINNAAIPTYLLDFMDTAYVPGHLHGTCTRLYGESSFDSLQITGDFMVVNIRESTITSRYPFGETGIRNAVKNLIAQCGFSTIYGHNRIADYDYDHNNEFDYVNMLVRNITRAYGGDNPGSGFNGAPISPIYIDGISYECKEGTFQCVGDGDFYANPTSIVIHEISHSLFGGNNFHTSGGNHRGSTETMAFLNIQGGYGLMGAAGSSLVSCNGYERWRMHWKHPQSSDYISALNSMGLVSVNSDISKEDGNQTFVLRDFVTFGDAVRIKLPYKDSETSSNQYIWLENHQICDDKLDFLQYSNSADSGCRPRGKAGIYAYYQIGRDILEGNEVWDNYHRDNLKIIPAEGYFDYVMEADTYNLNCISYDEHFYTLTRTTANSFCGGQDQESLFFPQNTDSVLNLSRERAMWRKKVDGVNEDWLSSMGDTLDAFVPPAKINMGTNPSSCNAKTLHNRNHELNAGRIDSAATHKNTQTTYLTGLSIEMLWVSRSSIKVNIRWDDYDIVNDTRWTGKIALKDTAILTTPYTITLAQNKTVALPYRDAETGLFSGRTQWRCESNSYFRQEDSTHVYLTENSSLVFQEGSTYEQAQNATMHVQAGCTLHIQSGANAILKGTLKIDSGALVIVNGIAHFDTSARLIVNPGGKLLVEGGKLTSMGTNAMWRGVEVLGNRTKHQVAQFQGTVELKDGAVIELPILCHKFLWHKSVRIGKKFKYDLQKHLQ